jgi:hypothetical protein
MGRGNLEWKYGIITLVSCIERFCSESLIKDVDVVTRTVILARTRIRELGLP